MKEIVVATDGSAGSQAAVKEAFALAREVDAEVTFVSVFRPPSALLGDPFYARSLHHGLVEARGAVEAAIAKAETMAVDAHGEVVEGDPATEIVRLAERREADLIVVGSRGHGPLASAIVGSVSSAVIRDARCPVVVVSEQTASARKAGHDAGTGPRRDHVPEEVWT